MSKGIPKTTDKDLNKIMKLAHKQGKWAFKDSNNHIRGRCSDGIHTTTISKSPKTKGAFIKTKKIFKDTGVEGL